MLRVSGENNPKNIYEAEYAYLNNYNLTRDTKIVENQARPEFSKEASKHALVTHIGNNAENYIEFKDVYVTKKGKYTLKVFYFAKDKKKAELYINGKKKKIRFPKAVSDGIVTKRICLDKGFNTIKFSSPKAFMADLDKIEIE